MYKKQLLITCLSLLLLSILTVGEADAQKNKYQEDLSSVRPTFNENEEENGEPASVSDTEDITESLNNMLEQQAKANKNIKHAVGYRIHLFSGRDRSAFNEAKAKIYNILPDIEVYETYSQPTYKIDAGDFIDKIEAFAAYKKAKKEFPAAQLIREKVNIR